jgi:hypothetical protein
VRSQKATPLRAAENLRIRIKRLRPDGKEEKMKYALVSLILMGTLLAPVSMQARCRCHWHHHHKVCHCW